MQETTAKRKFENANLEGERLGERLIESLRMQKGSHKLTRRGRERCSKRSVILHLSFSIGAAGRVILIT